MKNCNCILVTPNNEEWEIPYYELEHFCKKIVCDFIFAKKQKFKESLDRKKKFYEFQKNYRSFSPYFDFVFLELGYKLKKPFLIPDSILVFQEINGIIYYYAKYFKEKEFLSSYNRECINAPLFIQANEKNIICKSLNQFCYQIPDSYITELGKIIYLNSFITTHDFWANLWIHNYLMSSKEFCEKYVSLINEDFIYRGMGLLLQKEKLWLRLARGGYGEYLIAANKTDITLGQQQCISYIEKKYQRVLICQ